MVRARTAFEEVTKHSPGNAFAWASLAETYSRLKQPSAAADAAKKAEQFGGDNPAIDHALAIYFTQAGAFQHAAELEAKFAASPRADPDAEARVAGLYLNAGDLAKALPAAQKAVDTHPSAAAEDVLGRVFIALGKNAEGETHLSAAWAGAKPDPAVAFDYVRVLLSRQDFDDAAEVLTTALSAHPDDAQLVLALGVARYGQRRFEEAITTFLKVIRIDPQIEQPYVFLGKMLDQAGDHLTEITADYEKWLAQNPKNPEALLLLAKARLAANSKDESAEGLLRKSIVLGDGNWEAHYELGVLLESKRDFGEAEQQLKRSIEIEPKQAMPHYHLARVYDRLGNAEGAKAERETHQKLTGAGPK